MSTRKPIAFLLLLMLVLAITGCGKKEDFPKAAMNSTTEFSLGSVKIEPLKNPSAQELYQTIVGLYDSLQSVSTTYTTSKYESQTWQMDDKGKITIANEQIKAPKTEFWLLNPSKSIIKMDDTPRSRLFQDGKDLFTADPDLHEYQKMVVPPVLQTHLVTHAFGLAPCSIYNNNELSPRTISKLTLLPDTKINGTDVYVLEMCLAYSRNKRIQPGETRRFYIGKADLLPRKIQFVYNPISSNGLADNGNLKEFIFVGFKCNPELPNNIFTLTPPAGWKVHKDPVKKAPPSMEGQLPPNMDRLKDLPGNTAKAPKAKTHP